MGFLREREGEIEREANNAKRDCCRPVPQMITSHVVSLSDSMVGWLCSSRWEGLLCLAVESARRG